MRWLKAIRDSLMYPEQIAALRQFIDDRSQVHGELLSRYGKNLTKLGEATRHVAELTERNQGLVDQIKSNHERYALLESRFRSAEMYAKAFIGEFRAHLDESGQSEIKPAE